MADGHGSVTRWLAPLRDGDPQAARMLWDRYFDRLVRLARRRIAASGRPGADADEEDAALSAFAGFCDALVQGRFLGLGDRDQLWRLLATIAARKATAQVGRRAAVKRGGDRCRLGAIPSDRDTTGDGLANRPGPEPPPDLAALMAEECRRLLDRLEDDDLRAIALWRMEGFTNDEIADRLGCARRTVARRLELIRAIWAEEVG